MASKVLSDEETEQLSTWPPEVARSDLVAYFTLSLLSVMAFVGLNAWLILSAKHA